MRIMVVDDEPALGLMLDRMLRRMGHEVVFAPDPELALQLLGQNIDAVISDIEMPRMNGVELAEEIRTRFRSMPICFCTGSDPEDDVVRDATKFGRVLPKDGRQETLRAMLVYLATQRLELRHRDLPPVRRAIRSRVSLVARIRFADLDELLEATTADVAEGGIFLATDKRVPVGTRLELTVIVDRPPTAHVLQGRVVRVVDEGTRGVAVALEGAPSAWLRFCEELAASIAARP